LGKTVFWKTQLFQITYFEEPVAAMFTVRLSEIETFDTGWVSLEFVPEDVRVVFQIPLIECETWNEFRQKSCKG
jgi:hypothetical protein